MLFIWTYLGRNLYHCASLTVDSYRNLLNGKEESPAQALQKTYIKWEGTFTSTSFTENLYIWMNVLGNIKNNLCKWTKSLHIYIKVGWSFREIFSQSVQNNYCESVGLYSKAVKHWVNPGLLLYKRQGTKYFPNQLHNTFSPNQCFF